MESPFFMIEDALKRIQPDMMFGQAGALQAFDVNRQLYSGQRASEPFTKR